MAVIWLRALHIRYNSNFSSCALSRFLLILPPPTPGDAQHPLCVHRFALGAGAFFGEAVFVQDEMAEDARESVGGHLHSEAGVEFEIRHEGKRGVVAAERLEGGAAVEDVDRAA